MRLFTGAGLQLKTIDKKEYPVEIDPDVTVSKLPPTVISVWNGPA